MTNNQFLNPAAWTGKSVMLFVKPFGERQVCQLALAIALNTAVSLASLTSFGLFGAAVLAEPTVAEIEEVGGLMH